MVDFIKLIRLKHSIKNILIFLPLFFSGLIFDLNLFTKTLFGFICFTMVASCIYIINDLNDYELDRKHPTKKKRPIASGRVSMERAAFYCVFIFLLANILIIVFKIPLVSAFLIYTYFILNLGYSFKLKNIPLVDIIILVSGFIIRIAFGATLLSIPISNWLLLTIIAVSFYMGLGKRRNEIGSKTREVLKYYNKEFLDKNMYTMLSCAIVFYSLWTVDADVALKSNNLLVWTVPLIIVLAMRYSMIIEGASDADPVEVIMSDKYLIFIVIITALLIFGIIYIF